MSKGERIIGHAEQLRPWSRQRLAVLVPCFNEETAIGKVVADFRWPKNPRALAGRLRPRADVLAGAGYRGCLRSGRPRRKQGHQDACGPGGYRPHRQRQRKAIRLKATSTENGRYVGAARIERTRLGSRPL
jgi:hypothetical protein